MRRLRQQRGFTLVEMVTVIMVLGVLVVGVSSFIIFGTRIFIESSAAEQVTGESRYAIERMTRDIRASLPGSARLGSGSNGSESWQCLELLPIEASTSYIDIGLSTGSASASAILFRDAPQTAISAGQFAFVYPLTASEVYSAPVGSVGKRFAVQAITEAADGNTINLAFGSAVRFTESSPRKRIFLTGTPISYCFVANTSSGDIRLWHFGGYGFSPSQPDIAYMRANGRASLMAKGVVTPTPLSVQPSTLINNAVIQLNVSFTINGQSFSYQHQAQVINVP